MWKELKKADADNEREVFVSVRMGRKNPKSEGWNDEVRVVVEMKEMAWKDVLKVRKWIVK